MNATKLKTILVLEPSATFRKILEMSFLGSPTKVLVPRTVEEGFNLLRQGTIDLVFIDVVNAQFGGYELCKRLKQEMNAVYVVLMFGKSAPIDRSQKDIVGADAEIEKPFETAHLIEVIGNLLLREPKSLKSQASDGSQSSRASQISKSSEDLFSVEEDFVDVDLMENRTTTNQVPPNILAQPEQQEDIWIEEPEVISPPVSSPPARTPSQVRPSSSFKDLGPSLEPPKPKHVSAPSFDPGFGVPAAQAEVDVWTLTDAPSEEEEMLSVDLDPKPNANIPAVSVKGPEFTSPPPKMPPAISQSRTADLLVEASNKVSREAKNELSGLSMNDDELRRIARETVERIAWEVIPDLAEAIIRAELDRLLQANDAA